MLFLFSSHAFIQICFRSFAFVLSNKYHLSEFMLLGFHCQKISFLCKQNLCIGEKHTQWHWDTKEKYFMKVFHGWWNAPKTVFHEMFWKKNFKVFFPLRKGVLKVCSKFTGEREERSKAKQLHWNHTSAWVLSRKFAAYFQNTFS